MTAVKTKKKKQLFRDDAIAPRDESQKQEEFTRNQFTICKEKLLNYCQKWRNIYAIAADLDITIPETHTNLNRLEKEGLMESRKDSEEWRRTPDSWLSGDWLIEDKQSIEEIFWVRVSVGRKLISFEIGEDAEGLGKYAKDEIYRFEISKRSLVSMVKKYNILPTEMGMAYCNSHLTKRLGMCLGKDSIYFLDEKFKILAYSRSEIEKIIKIDDISPQEFFFAKANEQELNKGDRVSIINEPGNDWTIASIKYPWCEIYRGNGCKENFKKLPLWMIQKCEEPPKEEVEKLAKCMLDALNLDRIYKPARWHKAEDLAFFCSIELEDNDPRLSAAIEKLESDRLIQSKTEANETYLKLEEKQCSDTSNSSEELEDFQERSNNGSQTTSEPPATSISTSQRSPSTDRTSPASQSLGTSETSSQNEASMTSSPADFLAPEPQTQEPESDSIIRNQDSGEKDSESSVKSNQDLPLSSNLWELSTEALELSLPDCEWQAIQQKLKLSQQADSERHISADDYLQLPTLTANNATANSRPAGRSKLEQKFVTLGVTANGSKLSASAMSLLMGYPANWCEAIAPLQPSTQPASQKAKGGSKAESSSEKPSRPHKQGSHSQGCATSKGSQEDENILPTPAPIIEQRFEIELLSGEKVERGIGGLLNHLVEGAPLNQFEIGAIAYIEKQYRGELYEGKLSRIFEKEWRDKVISGDWIIIDRRHCMAGKIYQVQETRGGYIQTVDGFSFHPDRYVPLVGSLIEISDRHPVKSLAGSTVEVESVKDGYIKIKNGGSIAFEHCKGLAVIGYQSPVISDQSPITEQPPTNNQQQIQAKAISLWQPWASLIGMQKKQFETRSWATDYRGKILICGAKRAKAEQLDIWIEISDRYGFKEEFKDLPLGYAIAICDLADCILMDEEFIEAQSQLERDCGDWQPGRYAWKLENIIPIDPQPIRGYQGLWNVDIAPYIPPKKKRGRKPGSRNKKAAKGHLYKRKDCNSYLYEYWDNDKKKKRCLSVSANLFPTIDKAIADGESVGKIIAKIKGTSQQLNLF